MLKYTQVVFDVDGTLVDSRMSALNSLQQVVGEYTGMVPPLEDLYSSTGIPGENALRQLAAKYQLKITGGSDFHGANKPKIHLGTGKGNLRITYEIWKNLW